MNARSANPSPASNVDEIFPSPAKIRMWNPFWLEKSPVWQMIPKRPLGWLRGQIQGNVPLVSNIVAAAKVHQGKAARVHQEYFFKIPGWGSYAAKAGVWFFMFSEVWVLKM